jgi:ABC-2 type transport system ATP-binding protein
VVGKDIDFPKSIGMIIETPGFVPYYSGLKNLVYLASLRGTIKKSDCKQYMGIVGLDPVSRKHVSKYSLGMRQRLGIAQAIMEDPDILVLDEPMNGLDKQGIEDIKKLLLEFRDKNKTILIASHSQADIDELCDTVHEMDSGVLKAKIKLRSAIVEKSN